MHTYCRSIRQIHLWFTAQIQKFEAWLWLLEAQANWIWITKEFTQSRRSFSLLLFLFCQRGRSTQGGRSDGGSSVGEWQASRKIVAKALAVFNRCLSLPFSPTLSPSLFISFWFISLAQKLLYFDSRQTNVRIEIKREAATGSSEWKTWRERRNRRVGSRITPSSVAATPTSSCSCPSSFDCYTHTHTRISAVTFFLHSRIRIRIGLLPFFLQLFLYFSHSVKISKCHFAVISWIIRLQLRWNNRIQMKKLCRRRSSVVCRLSSVASLRSPSSVSLCLLNFQFVYTFSSHWYISSSPPLPLSLSPSAASSPSPLRGRLECKVFISTADWVAR